MARIIFNENSMHMTAQAVFIINRNGSPDAESVARYMRVSAERQHESEPDFRGYLSTGGWILIFWDDDDGNLNVRAAVEPYGVLRYLGER